jgi:threonine/homoserine/homoserine lactone efflux protein
MGILKMITYPFGATLVGMLTVVLAAMAMFGANYADWQEWQNRMVGEIGTIAGFVGAVTGLYIAIRSEQRAAR